MPTKPGDITPTARIAIGVFLCLTVIVFQQLAAAGNPTTGAESPLDRG